MPDDPFTPPPNTSGISLYDAIVEPIRKVDKTHGADLLLRYLVGPQAIHDRTTGDILTLFDQIQPSLVRSELLTYLKDIVGFTRELRSITDQLTELQLRRLVQLAIPFWNQRHTESGLLNSIRLLTGRSGVFYDWFYFRFLLGEAEIGEEQLVTGGDSWIIGGATSLYDEFWSNLRLMDDGTLDEQLLVDLVRLMRPTNERIEIFLTDFLEQYDIDLARWLLVSGPAPIHDTVNQTMELQANTVLEPIIPITFGPGLSSYVLITKFRLDDAAASFRVQFYIDPYATAFYQVTIKLTSFRVELASQVDGLFSLLVSTNPVSVSLVEDVWYKLRVQVINDESDQANRKRLIRVYIDNNLVIPTSGEDYINNTLATGRPGYGIYQVGAFSGRVSLDDTESWRIPGRFATVGLSSVSEPSGALTASSTFFDGGVRTTIDWMSVGAFTRSTEGARLEQGTNPVAWDAADVRRLDNRNEGGGSLLLLERAATNLVPWSETLNNWTPTGTPVLTGGQTAPDSAADAYQVQDDDGAAIESIGTSLTVAESTRYVASYWIKQDAITTRFPEFQHTRGGNTAHVQLNTSTGAFSVRTTAGFTGVFAGVESIGGWWRLWLRFFVPAGQGGTLNLAVLPAATGTFNAAPAAGATGSIILWGAQVEVGRSPSASVRTAGVAFTRSADSLVLAAAEVPPSFLTKAWRILQFSPAWAASELMGVVGGQPTDPWIFTIGGSANGLRIRFDGATPWIEAIAGGVTMASKSFANARHALMGELKWDPVAAKIYLGGVVGSTGTPWVWPQGDLRFGGVAGSSGLELDGRVYPIMIEV